MARQRKQIKTATDNPKLKWKELSDGSMSAYLEYYLGFDYVTDKDGNKIHDEKGRPKVKAKRRKEFLKLTIPKKTTNPIERIQREETLTLAEAIRREREKAFLSAVSSRDF